MEEVFHLISHHLFLDRDDLLALLDLQALTSSSDGLHYVLQNVIQGSSP